MKIKPMLGEFALEDIEYIESSESRALVEHRVPGLAGNYFQDLGTVPNTIVICGTKVGDDARDTFLTGIREIFNKGEPTTFVADINTATDLPQVVIEDLQVAEIGGSANSFRYLIKLRKYIEPPEPPSNSSFDLGILDDALNLTNVLDVLDALSSIPNLGDPTQSLRGALDGVKSATNGLDAAVTQVQSATQAIPSTTSPTEILAPVLGDESSGTGVAGVLKVLETLDSANLSLNLSADLDKGFSASVSVDPKALTGGALGQFQEAVAAIPKDPSSLIAPLSASLKQIEKLSSADLSAQLQSAVKGLQTIGGLIPLDTSTLVSGIAEGLSQIKGEFISGEFGELREWSKSVQALYAEIEPLLAGAGTLTDRLIAYLEGKIKDLVSLVLPNGNIALELAGKLDLAISGDLLAQIEALKVKLIGYLNAARLEFENKNFSNTMQVSLAQEAFKNLTALLATLASQLKVLLVQDGLTVEALTRLLKQQFDDFLDIEIVDLGNIKDKFTAAIKRLETAIRKLDLSRVRTTIEGVFGKIDGAIAQFDLGQFTNKLADLKGQLQSVLTAIDGTLLEVVASIRAIFTRIREALRSVTETLGSFDENGKFQFHVQKDIENFLNGIKTTLQNTIEPLLNQLKTTVGQALQQVQDGLNAVKGEIDAVKSQLEGTLQGISGQLKSVNVAGMMETIRQSLDGMLSGLGVIDFDPIIDPVIAQINEMAAALKKIDFSAMGEFALGPFKVSAEVVTKVNFSADITGALMAEFDELLDLPQKALSGIEVSVEGALQQLKALEPGVLLTPLNDLFDPITAHLDALDLKVLLKPLDAWYEGVQAELKKVSPSALLQPLGVLYTQLQDAFKSVSPEALIQPLAAAVEKITTAIETIDITGIATELKGVIDRVKAQVNRISPEPLLNPLVNAFDKIVGALDSFDPAILLQPLLDIFNAIAEPLANLTAESAARISDVFALLRKLLEAFAPRSIFGMLREKFSAINELVQQLNVGGLIAALKAPYDAMHASFVAQGGPVNVSLSASVEGLNPLRDPSVTQGVADLQQVQAKLKSWAAAEAPADLVLQYDEEVKQKLESIVPVWARENVTASSIRRAFELSNPLDLREEVRQLYDAIKEQVRTFDPRLVQEKIKATFGKATEAIFGLQPDAIVQEVQGVIDALTQRLKGLDLQLIVNELEGVAAEVNGVIAGLNPKPIIDQLQGMVEEVMRMVAALQPSQLLGELNVPFLAAKEIVAEFKPSVFLEPLQEVFKEIQVLLEAIDIGVILQPLADRLKQLRDELEAGLKRTETAFNGMLQALPV
jgi:hypothetical protein